MRLVRRVAGRRALLAGLAVVFPVGMAMLAGVMPVQAQPAQQPTAGAGQVVTVYSYRQPFLIRPVLEAFTRRTGIKVRTAFARKGLLERLRAEGENTPADVVITADFARLWALKKAGLLRPVESEVLRKAVPAHLRDEEGQWFGLTKRARIIVAHKDRVKDGEIARYADLAAPHMKGRVCIRSGKHPYNVALFASMIAHDGRDATRDFLKGLKANLARKPQGNDRAQARAIHEGVCDVALLNSYYLGKMATNEKKPEQKEWYGSLKVIFPEAQGRGTHVNISGGAVVKHAKNPQAGQKLLEFMVSEEAQRMYAALNHEYPVRPGVQPSELVRSWGELREDRLPLTEIARRSREAARLVDEVGLDH